MKVSITKKISLAGLFMFCLFEGKGQAACDFYTAKTTPSGAPSSDTNPGTSSLPFLSIKKGASFLGPGKTLCIGSGVYEEAFEQKDLRSGSSWQLPASLIASPDAPTGSVILRPLSGNIRVITLIGVQYIVFQGLVFDATQVSIDAIKITNSSTSAPAHHIRFQDCEIKNAPEQGVLTSGGADYNEFIRVKVHGNGFGSNLDMACDHYHGFYLSTGWNRVESSLVFNNAGFGIHVFDSYGTGAHDNDLIGNRVYDNAACGRRGAGIILSSGSGNKAINNIIFRNNIGVQVDYGAIQSEIINNTIYGNLTSATNGNRGIYLGTGSTGAIVKNNIVFKNVGPFFGEDLENVGSISSTISSNLVGIDPIFVNETSDDFHLTPSSLRAIDRGEAIDGLATDADGMRRPAGLATDLGAYELQNSIVPPPTPLLPTPIPIAPTPTPTPVIDLESPKATLVNPKDGSKVYTRSKVTLNGSANDNQVVIRVEFYVNGTLVCTDSVSPYSCIWSVPRGRGKTYELFVKAIDAASNVGNSNVIRVISQ